MSNAGRLVLLRIVPGRSSTVEAVQVVDRELREVVFGDPAVGLHDRTDADELIARAPTAADLYRGGSDLFLDLPFGLALLAALPAPFALLLHALRVD